jgi:type IV fimbrial biogenesis protein FimT
MQSKTLPSQQRGVTLIEACAVMAIAAILAGTALPAFDGITKKQVIDGSSTSVLTAVQFARSAAVAQNAGVRLAIKPRADGGSCLLVHTGQAGVCSCSTDNVPQCTGEATPLAVYQFPVQSAVKISANVASMRFDPINGTTTPTGTIAATLPDGRAIHHVVNIMGRAKTCSPGGAVAGHKPC